MVMTESKFNPRFNKFFSKAKKLDRWDIIVPIVCIVIVCIIIAWLSAIVYFICHGEFLWTVGIFVFGISFAYFFNEAEQVS